MQYVNVDNADQYLKPGDIMMKRLGDASPATSIGIDGMVSLGSTGFCADAGFGKSQANGTAVSLGNCARTPSTSWARAL